MTTVKLPEYDDLNKKLLNSIKPSSNRMYDYDLNSLVNFVHEMLIMYQTNLFHKLG